jgi:type I restriction enzyme S subunit
MPYEFIYPLVVDKIDDLLNCQTGGAQQHINKNDVNGLPILIPDEESMIDYKNLTKSLYEEIACVCFETKTLAATRDALLPKLMSGEINVEKVKVA